METGKRGRAPALSLKDGAFHPSNSAGRAEPACPQATAALPRRGRSSAEADPGRCETWARQGTNEEPPVCEQAQSQGRRRRHHKKFKQKNGAVARTAPLHGKNDDPKARSPYRTACWKPELSAYPPELRALRPELRTETSRQRAIPLFQKARSAAFLPEARQAPPADAEKKAA